MVRGPGRSRGCQTCRRRRIKCDESQPGCTQCKKYGKKCPGSIIGTFYVITAETQTTPSSIISQSLDGSRINGVSGSEDFSATHDSSDYRSQEIVRHDLPTADAPISGVLDTGLLTESSKDKFLPKILSYHQPSRACAFEQLFFSHYFDACGQGIETVGACSWVAKLPTLLGTSFPSLTMKYSTRATCMAFYGILNGEVSIQTEARRTYTKALETRRTDISQQSRQKLHEKQPSALEEVVCATIMMSYFELILKTTPLAWTQHLDAAAAMLETIGPEGCQYGLYIHQLFRTVRLGKAFTSVIHKTKQVFAQERWKTIPFRRPKGQLDKLIDVILSISDYILIADNMSCITSTFKSKDPMQKFRASINGLIATLDNLIQNDDIELPTQANLPPPALFNSVDIVHQELCSDSFSGCLAAIRHAAYLICFSLLAPMDSVTSSNQSLAIDHSELVLRAINYVDLCSQSPVSSLYMTTVFSLNVVLAWSPSPAHKEYALRKLENSPTVLYS